MSVATTIQNLPRFHSIGFPCERGLPPLKAIPGRKSSGHSRGIEGTGQEAGFHGHEKGRKPLSSLASRVETRDWAMRAFDRSLVLASGLHNDRAGGRGQRHTTPSFNLSEGMP